MKKAASVTPEEIAIRYKNGARVELITLNSLPVPACQSGEVVGTNGKNINIKLDNGTFITTIYGEDYIKVALPRIRRGRR